MGKIYINMFNLCHYIRRMRRGKTVGQLLVGAKTLVMGVVAQRYVSTRVPLTSASLVFDKSAKTASELSGMRVVIVGKSYFRISATA